MTNPKPLWGQSAIVMRCAEISRELSALANRIEDFRRFDDARDLNRAVDLVTKVGARLFEAGPLQDQRDS